MLEVKNLTVRYGDRTILDDASFSVAEGDWLVIAGPNGAGKSTVINAVSQAAPYTGSVFLFGRDVRNIKPALLARDMGVLAQSHFVGYEYTVEQVVSLGRYSHGRGLFKTETRDDAEKIDMALRLTGMDGRRRQSVLTLSGGELQRTFLAQVLAQDPRLLLLDEPTNHLDLKYQKLIFEIVAEWLKTPGRAAVCVVHDLSLARARATKALLLCEGKIAAMGDPAKVFSRETLNAAYDMDVYEWMREMLSQWEA